MILEAIVTTENEDGSTNISPMGPTVQECMDRFLLRPFPTSRTWQNLQRTSAGILHVTDDVEILARAAIGQVDPPPRLEPARCVAGHALSDACRWYEFRVAESDSSQQRVRIECAVVHTERRRDFFGFNRAKHAVVEAAILATRLEFLPRTEILAEFDRLRVIVEKTAGEQERRAFAVLEQFVGQ